MIFLRSVPYQAGWPDRRVVTMVELETDRARCSDCGQMMRRGRRAYLIEDRGRPVRLTHPKGKCGDAR